MIGIAFSSVCCGDDASAGKTTLKVYPVGNLVSVEAVNRNTGGRTTSDEWASEYPETRQALEELRSVVQAMCPGDEVSVVTYEPSLCLIVRHSAAGHDDVGQLLRTLSERSVSSILLECRALYAETPAKLYDSTQGEPERRRLEALLTKRQLTTAQTSELLALLPPAAADRESVSLRPGRRKRWGHTGRPCTAMARVDQENHRIDIRLDYVSDDYQKSTPFGSETFSLAKGESALFRHYCDGGTVVWLISARVARGGTATMPVSKRDP